MIAEKAAAPAPADVLEIVQGLARELQPQRGGRAVSLDSSLERDLGFDSLGRVELLARLEKAFGVRLPEGLLGAAETPRDLLAALAVAHPAAARGRGLRVDRAPGAAARRRRTARGPCWRCSTGTPSATPTGGTCCTTPATASPRS